MAEKCQKSSGCDNGTKCLTVCPTNVKEAIDWIVCLTGKDGCHCLQPQPPVADSNKCLEKVANEVWELLTSAPISPDTSLKWCWDEFDMTKDSDTSSKKGTGGTYVKDLINGLGDRFSKFLGCIDCTQQPSPHCTCGKCTRGLAKLGYTYCYKSGSDCCINTKDTDANVCAKILLGCMPLIFSSLTYLYWNCCDNVSDAKWKDCTLTSGSTGSLSTYLITLGYDVTQLTECKGSVIKTFFHCFSELPVCIVGKQSADQLIKKAKSYATFIYNIQTVFNNTDQEEGKKMPLQRLYMGASFYFQATQGKHNQRLDKSKRPESICELLYWLLGIPYTPMGVEVDTRSLGELLGEENEDNEKAEAESCSYLPSAKCCKPPAGDGECPMTPEDADPYLLPPCYYSAFVVLSIQGSLVSGKNTTVKTASSSGGNENKTPEPFLHELYTNQHFNFYYPSSIRSWAAMVWDVLYALYFQLGFLYKQCKVEYKNGYGWKDCKYGKGVKCSESQTWMCTTSQSNVGNHDECGKDPNRCSPLQGYLCDKLKDFRCVKNGEESKPESKSESEPESKSYCTHLDHRPPSQWCPIPMGFEKSMKNLSPERKGEHISVILDIYFEYNTVGSSLYQLMLLVGIVSLRPPRCLGDMFAFYCGIGRLSDATPPPKDDVLNKILRDTIKGYPGSTSPDEMTKSLKTLAGGCTQSVPSKDTCVSLCSLSQPDGSKCNCNTKYLCSISWSVYTVFSTRHIECYLSWVVYMIDEFKTNLEAFLKHLEDVECNHGCSHCTDKQKCHNVNDKSGCKCNVVECKRILGALYSFGFTYQDADSLKTGNKNCTEFIQQLKAVAEGSSLEELIKAVNQVLYSIRLAFIFWAWLLWTAAIVYLIFGLVVDLDILHIRSHIWLKHTHNIPAFNLFAARRLKHGIQVYFGR